MRKFRQQGFSLVELLVAIVVSLMLLVVTLKLFADSENSKRNVSSGGEAQANGAVAMYSLERELRFAGHGLTGDNVLGCSLLSYNSARTPNTLSIDRLAPVTVIPAGTSAVLSSTLTLPAADTNTDQIIIAYGNSATASEPVGFNDLISTKAGYALKNRVGFQVGDVVLAAESGKSCILLQVTGRPGEQTVCGQSESGDSNLLSFSTSAFLSPYGTSGSCVTTTSSINKTIPAVTYSASEYTATLSNLGPTPHLMAYAVRNGKLMACDLLTTQCANADTWTALVSNIVGMNAQVGWDTSGTADAVVDVFAASAPSAVASGTVKCQVSRMLSIRVGLVARNTQMEKEAVTTAAPTWQGGSFNLSTLSDWQKYRYKVFETIIPIRNMVWKGAISGC